MARSRLLLSLSAAAMLGAANAASAAVVDIAATDAAGTTLTLGPGIYKVSLAGIAGGGAYDGFSYWPANLNCDGDGANCTRGWADHFAIDFGNGMGGFDRTNGIGYGLAGAPGFRPVWDTAARALAEYSTRTLQSQLLSVIFGFASPANYFMSGMGTYTDVAGDITFTLSAAQDVNFFVIDTPYDDNRGGVSLAVVPEPAAWATMTLGFGAIGWAMRRRPKARTDSA